MKTGINGFLKNILKGLNIKAGKYRITVDTSLILLAPVTLWVIAALYVPIMGAGLTALQAWAIAGIILALMILSLFLHSFAHVFTIKTVCTTFSRRIFLSPLGDPAQHQTSALTAGREALTALAGIVTQGLLAVLFYVLWNLQINVFISAIGGFLIFFNLALMAINLVPAFPFDGGRIARAVIWNLTGKPGTATRLAWILGWGLAAGLAAWGIFLLSQHARFSLETAAMTFLFGVLTAISLLIHKSWKWDRPVPVIPRSIPAKVLSSLAAGLALLPMAAITFGLLPMNEGLEAPGFTAPVTPMVQVPPEYSYSPTGSLILVTVIPQAPILAAEWVYAHFDHSIRITPPAQIIPKDKTPQNVSLEDYRMLLDSETTAIIVGLQLAGYPVEVNNDGVSILSVVPASPAAAVLEPDDIIIAVQGNTVDFTSDLTKHLGAIAAGSVLDLKIKRQGETMDVKVPAMDPLTADGPVRIGIYMEQHNSGFTLPFPVSINPQKVNGGPSAGLMFTLGVYDMLTQQDLTGGRIIAGTGTIALDGRVGPIGGVQQKVVAAERAGAEYFLVPAENYTDAIAMATRVKVIKVTTAREAIDFLHSLPGNQPDLISAP